MTAITFYEMMKNNQSVNVNRIHSGYLVKQTKVWKDLRRDEQKSLAGKKLGKIQGIMKTSRRRKRGIRGRCGRTRRKRENLTPLTILRLMSEIMKDNQ